MTNDRENTILCQPSQESERRSVPADAPQAGAPDQRLIVIVGPTAVGKTAVAMHLARRMSAEIVNADSMQVYKYMDIGTAKPDVAERAGTAFHLIDVASPDRQLNVSTWKELAEEAIRAVHGRGKTAIVCGGTGLYIRSLLNDWKLARTPANPELRSALRKKASELGSKELHRELAAVDAVTASRLHPNDSVRIVRALEVYHTTGTSISDHQAIDRSHVQRLPARQFGLALPRPELYDRINARVDCMLALGFEEEVRSLLRLGFTPDAGPMRSLGYKEMVQYINHELGYTEAIEAIKQSTRRYAKRQQTWFHADPTIEWIDVSALSSATVASQILTGLEKEASGTISDLNSRPDGH